MASHTLVLELFYDGTYHTVPLYTRDGFNLKRGTNTPDSGLDPASASVTIDNRSGNYSPRSVASTLYGKIGQNTKARLTIDSSTQLVGEVVSWMPDRAIKGDAWTKIKIAGVLQRIGRGTDPVLSAMRRSFDHDAAQPVAYWPLEGGKGSLVAYDTISNIPTDLQLNLTGADGSAGAAQFGDTPLSIGSDLVANIAGGWILTMPMPTAIITTGQIAWQWHVNFGTTVRTGSGTAVRTSLLFDETQPRYMMWQASTYDSGLFELKALEFVNHSIVAGPTTVLSTSVTANLFDGTPRAFQLNLAASGGTNVAWTVYLNGVSIGSGTYTPGFSGAMNAKPLQIQSVSDAPNDQPIGFGHVGVSTSTSAQFRYVPLTGHVGETAADRFTRFLGEEGITADVIGNPAAALPMGPQRMITKLDMLDEIALTDDALIFETKDDIGLTMLIGASRFNRTPAATISYLGQIQPPLSPVFDDQGIRNDVTASNPAGTTRRVQQLTGPHNVQLPEDDPQGVGRYDTRIDVNPASEDALDDAAGWRVNVGTFDGTWYAEITADLDAAPSITTAVNALDIGDVIALSNLPVDEALDTVESIIIGIEQDMKDKTRRTVTFFCVPNGPYSVGLLALTTGDTDPFVGHLDPDGSTTVGSTAAGALTFSVATPSGPLWTTTADDFPFDVIVGGQRVSLSSISGASSPQTFTVKTTGRVIRYAIPAGSAVIVQQPIILAP